jgi:hypothetical protein
VREKDMSEQKVIRKKLNNIEEARRQIAQDTEKSSKYVKLEDGESKVFCFSDNMAWVEKASLFKANTLSRKYEFEVTDTETQQVKVLSLSPRFADQIIDKLHEQQRYIKVKRKGKGIDTMYSFENAS